MSDDEEQRDVSPRHRSSDARSETPLLTDVSEISDGHDVSYGGHVKMTNKSARKLLFDTRSTSHVHCKRIQSGININ